MLDYLLEEKNFTSLKEYVDFLDDLAPALEEIRRYSELIARSGHKMVTPPNAQMLARTALANRSAWRAITATVPVLGDTCGRSLLEARLFIREFRAFTQGEEGLRLKIIEIDPARFSLAKSPGWGAEPPKDVIDLMREIGRQLNGSEKAIADFKRAVNSIGATLHSIFARFIESLSIDLCICDAPLSKIESYYAVGKIGLPGMQYDPTQPYSQEERKQNARGHLARLRSMRLRAASAVDNLNDFCYRLQYLLALARRKLQSNHPSSTWSRSNGMLTLVEGPLIEVKEMSDKLLAMARTLA